jgi:hypothetical protein
MNVKGIFLLYVQSKAKNMAGIWSNCRTREWIIQWLVSYQMQSKGCLAGTYNGQMGRGIFVYIDW